MAKHFEKELEKLRRRLLTLCAKVEENVIMAVDAFEKRDIELARTVIKKDDEIDQMEIEIEEDCLKILALHQPVAIDLRFLVAVLKMNNDLERIGDLALKIAYNAKDLVKFDVIPVKIDVAPLVDTTRQMLKDALDSLINLDVELAEKVITTDDVANKKKKEIRNDALKAIEENPNNAKSIILLLGVARSLERISDLTTNIAEDVIYLINGEIVRHRREDDSTD
jgi:phosphate transport system protein